LKWTQKIGRENALSVKDADTRLRLTVLSLDYGNLRGGAKGEEGLEDRSASR